MTSSDDTALPAGAIGELSHRVGASYGADRTTGREHQWRIGAACAKFNGAITLRLVEGLIAGLVSSGIDPATLGIAWVPGAFELPLAAQKLALSGRYDAVVCLGAVVRGGTPHFDFVAHQCAAGIEQVALATGVPVLMGVLTTDDIGQALDRSKPGDPSNKGYEAAIGALEMADMLASLAGAGPASDRPASDRPASAGGTDLPTGGDSSC